MKPQMIIDAYCKIRTIDNTIPDDVLDFMKDSAIEKLSKLKLSNSKLSVRCKNVLFEGDFNLCSIKSLVTDLENVSLKQFSESRKVGKRTIKELTEFCRKMDIRLKP